MEKDETIKELKMCFDNLFYIWLGFGSLRSPSYMHYMCMFNVHWWCQWCGMLVCIDCYNVRKQGSRPIKVQSIL
jgi:hypothetical protein